MRPGNIAWNLAGLVIPLLFAAVAIPLLIHTIGLERFGLLSLAWALTGYAGVFDLGVGRATTQFLGELRGQNAYSLFPEVAKTAVTLTATTGAVGFLILAGAAFFGAQGLIKHSQSLNNEITYALYLLALDIPIQAVSSTYRGISEAFERFRAISIVRMFVGSINFAVPLLVSYFTISLPWLICSLVVSRVISLFSYRTVAMRAIKAHSETGVENKYLHLFDRSCIQKRLFGFGGWFTVSGIVSPLLVQSDRFVIGALISASAVAVYAIPYEVVVRSLVIVGAITSVAFPSMAKLLHQDRDGANSLFSRWNRYVIGLMFIVSAALALLLPVILPLWIGKGLPAQSVQIGQILCAGVFANSVGSMYFMLAQAHGRADYTAILHLIELPIYLALLWILLVVLGFGLTGVAWAWTARMAFDAACLILIARAIKNRCDNVDSTYHHKSSIKTLGP